MSVAPSISMTLRIGAPDRRRHARGLSQNALRRGDLIDRIVGSFREMPGLRLTLREAALLLGLPETTCLLVLNSLAEDGRLIRDDQERYALA